VPDLSLRAALTTISRPPARAPVLRSGAATRFETTTNCPNGNPLRRLTAAGKYNPQSSSNVSVLPAQTADSTDLLCFSVGSSRLVAPCGPGAPSWGNHARSVGELEEAFPGVGERGLDLDWRPFARGRALATVEPDQSWSDAAYRSTLVETLIAQQCERRRFLAAYRSTTPCPDA
jgi:hypothetical protein